EIATTPVPATRAATRAAADAEGREVAALIPELFTHSAVTPAAMRARATVMSPWARPSRRRSCRLAYSALHEFVRSDIVCPHSLTVSEKLCWVSSPGSACVPPCGWSLGVVEGAAVGRGALAPCDFPCCKIARCTR